MYLSNLKLWNFRKFGNATFDLAKPNLDLNFTKGLNVLIGENDSGKTAIIDAIKLVLKTHSYEWIKLESEDFYFGSDRLRIELVINDLTDDEAAPFPNWLGYTGAGDDIKVYLRLIFDVTIDLNTLKIFASDICAGTDTNGHPLTTQAREYLKVTYLKPLRDAQSELIPKKNSRLSQILQAHEAFKGKEKNHDLVSHFTSFNTILENYFKGKDGADADLVDLKGKELKDEIDSFVQSFFEKGKKSKLHPNDALLRNILERLGLYLIDDANPGLGSLNRLFMASELLHLKKTNWNGLRLGLIEELEAHLHPQSQMQVIEVLQRQKEIQLILTTHSPNIGSKLKLENLIICHNNKAFPMGESYTKLSPTDYTFLERFLDTSKANLFFAKGVILVEGWAEEILIPSLAKKIEVNLTEKGVSIVNVGNTAFLRYVNVFVRQNEPYLELPVSVINDLDLRPKEYSDEPDFQTKLNKYLNDEKTTIEANGEAFNELVKMNSFLETNKIITVFNAIDFKAGKAADFTKQSVKGFISPDWTLEYCIAKSEILRKLFYKAILMALKEQKINEGVSVTRLASYEIAITNIETHFTNWTETNESIAYSIYAQMLGEKKVLDLAIGKISKSIVAQHFAQLLDEDITIIKEDLEADPNILYLINAIKYAAKCP
jgi:putative ATP-dependent endonuclease of the OLD family